jgi:flagellar motor switch protein FliM
MAMAGEPDGEGMDEAGAGEPLLGRAAAMEDLLAQSEIDALTGFVDQRPGPDGAGLRAMFDAEAAPSERLPMLEVVFERFAKAASASLKESVGPGCSVSISRLATMRCADYVDDLTLPTQAFVFEAVGWGGSGFLAVAPGISQIVLEKLLGGGRVSGRPRGADRPPTALETALLTRLVTVLLGEAEKPFSELSPVAFALRRVETDPRLAEVARPGEAVLVAELRLDLDGRSGQIDLALPLSTVEPIRHLLAERFMGDGAGRDGLWPDHMATEVWQAEIETGAVLHEVRLPLGRVLDLAVGDTLMFDLKPSDLIEVRCGGVPLTRGRMGRVEDRIAVQIVEPLRPRAVATGRAMTRG